MQTACQFWIFRDSKWVFMCYFILPDWLFALFSLCIDRCLRHYPLSSLIEMTPTFHHFYWPFQLFWAFPTVAALIFFLRILTFLSHCPFVALHSSLENYFCFPPSCYSYHSILNVDSCLSATSPLVKFRPCPPAIPLSPIHSSRFAMTQSSLFPVVSGDC